MRTKSVLAILGATLLLGLFGPDSALGQNTQTEWQKEYRSVVEQRRAAGQPKWIGIGAGRSAQVIGIHALSHPICSRFNALAASFGQARTHDAECGFRIHSSPAPKC